MEIKGQGDIFNNPWASDLYLIMAIVAFVVYVVPNNNHVYSEFVNHMFSI
jgi:hypothetical protein